MLQSYHYPPLSLKIVRFDPLICQGDLPSSNKGPNIAQLESARENLV